MQNREIADALVSDVLEIGYTLGMAFVTLVKASPFLLIGYVLFIAPNC